jgi:hypothetical protein
MNLYTMTPKRPPKKWKKHFGTFGIENDGTIYLPSECSGRSAMEVLLCASYDGEKLVTTSDGKHALYRSGWLKEAFPECIETVQHIEKQIPEYIETAI